MFIVLKSELKNQLSSFSIGVVLAIFFIANTWFLSFSESQLNIFSVGTVSLEPFFALVPWLLLILIPASTMRLFAEEKKTGTIELLLTKPIKTLSLILGKYLAVVVILVITLILSLVYLYVVSYLSADGRIDKAATLGGYIGVFFIGITFASVGIFCSTCVNNPIISFLLSLSLSFFLYVGFDGLSAMVSMKGIASTLLLFSAKEHYDAISRGIIHSRDIIYFISVVFLFLSLTRYTLTKYTH